MSFWKIKMFGLLLAAGLLAVLWRAADIQNILRQALEWISTLGVWGPLFFMVFYMVCTALFLPGIFLTLGAGAVFGVKLGTILVSIGSTLGAAGAFLIGRYLGREWVLARFSQNSKFQAIDRAVEREGWKIVGLVRLSPLFPFNVSNFIFGVSKVRFSHFVLASWVAMLPTTIMFVYAGSIAGSLSNLNPKRRPKSEAEWALYALGLVATVVATIYITHVAKKALDKKIGSPGPPEL